MAWGEIVQRFFGNSGSKVAAKNRLLLVIQDDRLGLTAEKKEMLRKDILEAISKYVDIDPDGFNMEFVHNTTEPRKEMRMRAPVQTTERTAVNGSK